MSAGPNIEDRAHLPLHVWLGDCMLQAVPLVFTSVSAPSSLAPMAQPLSQARPL